jgi:ribosomal protein S16
MLFHRIRLSMKKCKIGFILRIGLYRKIRKGSYNLIEKLGFYRGDPKQKVISLKTERLGYWLNKGAYLNAKVYRILRFFVPQKKIIYSKRVIEIKEREIKKEYK